MSLNITPIAIEGLSNEDNPFQTHFWAAVKKMNGWEAKAFSYHINTCEFQVLVLIKRLFLRFSVAYIPYGPEGIQDLKQLRMISDALKKELPKGCFFLRCDVPWQDQKESLPKGIKKTTYPIQPEGTVLVPLSGGPDEVFSHFRTRAKRNIRRSKDEILITEWDGDQKELKAWYETYTYTSIRDAFTPRSKAYMENILELGKRGDSGVESRLYLAWIGGSVIGGNIVLYTPKRALYLFGSSRHEYVAASPSYALQWYTIQDAVKRGCETYDLYGIAPENEEDHHLHSLNMFKTGFGGEKVYRAGCFDSVLNPFIYYTYRVVETIHMASARG